MNKTSLNLDALFEAARCSRAMGSEPMPDYLKSRILSQWRGLVRGEETVSVAVIACRRALLLAGLLMMLSLAWSAGDLWGNPPSEVAIANYEFQTDIMP